MPAWLNGFASGSGFDGYVPCAGIDGRAQGVMLARCVRSSGA